MIKLDGKELAKIKEEILKEKINNIPRKLTLAVILLSNDDLPTFGRPIIVINADFCSIFTPLYLCYCKT